MLTPRAMSCLIVGDEMLLWVVHRNPSSEIRMTVGLTSVTGACARPAFANSSRSASSGPRANVPPFKKISSMWCECRGEWKT